MSKYNNRRFKADGYRWDSIAEYARWCELRILETAGAISDLQVKYPKYELVPAFKHGKKRYQGVSYIPDFTYTENGRLVVEDVKGVKTAVYQIKKKLLLSQHPEITFIEVAA